MQCANRFSLILKRPTAYCQAVNRFSLIVKRSTAHCQAVNRFSIILKRSTAARQCGKIQVRLLRRFSALRGTTTMAAKRARKDAATSPMQSAINAGGISNSGLERVLRALKGVPELPEMTSKRFMDAAFHDRWTSYNVYSTSTFQKQQTADERSTAAFCFHSADERSTAVCSNLLMNRQSLGFH